MHATSKRIHESDEEDDLESLRLAALNSLKRPPTFLNHMPSMVVPISVPVPELGTPVVFNTSSKSSNKRGRFHGHSRVARNGSYNRLRNSNLISVPTIQSDEEPGHSINKKFLDQSPTKLILPQDRYCGSKMTSEGKLSECGSKFDRYNDSDESLSDSESEFENKSATESPKKLERTSSLEALMLELENEIQGTSKPPEEEVNLDVKPNTKMKLKSPEVIEISDNCKGDTTELQVTVDKKHDSKLEGEKIKPHKNQESAEVHTNFNIPVRCDPDSSIKSTFTSVSPQNNTINTSPIHHIPYVNSQTPVVSTGLPYAPTYSHFPASVIYSNSLPYPFPNLSSVVEPARNPRPLSPLTISSGIINSITAPLSPRSAAFVMQNREIVERRKKSPRRSYSRSPSPVYRGSLSPKYRRSPKRSPRISPFRRISPSRSISRRISPKSNSRHCSPKHVVGSPRRHNRHNRNEINNKSDDENKIAALNRIVPVRGTPSPEHISRTNSPIDAVFEARRKKFETGNIVATEGVIRLKPKASDEENVISTEQMEEDEPDGEEDVQNEKNPLLVCEDELDLGVDVTTNDMFFEEESDDDNEGHFKSSHQGTSSVSEVPFTQLLEETSKMMQNESLNGNKATYSSRNSMTSFSTIGWSKEWQPNYSNELEKGESSRGHTTNLERKSLKNSLQLKIDSGVPRRKPLIVSPVESKKIEIKIRNPSKYENISNSSKDDRLEVRKVEVSTMPSNIGDDENEIKVFNESEDDSKNGGDLRTQLSRKRAERQNKQSTGDGAQSRLLQSAFQSAIYKKSLKVNKEMEIAPLNGKLPIHLRLGTPGGDLFSDSIPQKNSRKRNKIRGNLDQV